ncbi:MAG: MazE family transcriptional regulator [Ignavibacteria bacterium RIFOXYB2_FULL_35_12]|nr:MAG: MazE family transcriptional regulator [Ignavibacteria bacterium GWA2_36_19]OGU62218.1 MAG: MazE family transcriptional regulator [Ignavibacteria bacterium GWF2_35_20]OGU82484.1 MAG: MazE family transcriptional regulator [Ignavibacteria bacterium RIFOXYA2_FULL_35_9]OGU84624.1 MAG: MazE family transcriptional regulator [Ignavibacteria bacterium RIFOXYA12_FULL_35_25]OGU96894.1 MAG: MazE family transcriptional regulator [Ignavibacteria bacterium RIFOXYB12_FULL_35_14]OGV00594.1 MAG: MazE fa
MKTKVIKIGNSRGIRIPKSLIDESGLKSEVEIEVNDGQIIIKPISKNRESWETEFRKMAKNKDDILLDSEILVEQSKWDKEEWEW